MAHGKYGNSFVLRTIRMLPVEHSLITQACAALNGIERSLLVQEAVQWEAARLGICWNTEPSRPLAVPWPYLPDREDEITAARTSITVSLALADLAKCAEHVHTSEPQFIIGATLAYIGRLQALFRGTRADTPENAKGIRAELRAIKLPAKYRCRAELKSAC